MVRDSTRAFLSCIATGFFFLTAGFLLAACSETSVDPKVLEARAKTLTPADPELADIYQRSCRTCHTAGETGAPLTGDRQAWGERLEQGMPTLVQHVVEGFGGMPPYGMCMDCQRDDFTALIHFMATPPDSP